MSTISLQVIGCGDAFGSGGQNNTCFYVKAPLVQLLVDCGATSLPALKRHGILIREIDVIILTHFHGDHYAGVPFLLLELAVFGQIKPLTIISPPGCLQRLEQLLSLLYPGSEVLQKVQINFMEYLPDQTIDTKHFSVKAFPVIHAKETLPHGVRIAVDDKIISYTGDTEWTDVLPELAANADLFICECCYYLKQVKGHLNYRKIEESLHLLKPKKLLLTHFDTEMLDNLQQVELPYAIEGQRIELN
jgi:ribonuclease BN (tRNA processing enzyme)